MSWERYCEDLEERTRHLPTCCCCEEKITGEYAYKVEGSMMCETCWEEYVIDNVRVIMEDWGADEW